jgi:hypothetical protein
MEDNPMRFLVQIEAFDTLAGSEADKEIRATVGPYIQRMVEAGKIQETGFLTDRRGGFFLIDVDAAEEIYEIFGPETFGRFHVQVSPVAPPEKVGQIFQQWAQEDR